MDEISWADAKVGFVVHGGHDNHNVGEGIGNIEKLRLLDIISIVAAVEEVEYIPCQVRETPHFVEINC